jgi:NADH:ubiquinone oxidoreductase subunit 3 (subunit A)
MLLEYILIFKYFFFCLFLALILFFVSFVLIYQNPNAEKISVYECGFSPFGDSRSRFEVRFYIVAILFMIFDLEIVFLFP